MAQNRNADDDTGRDEAAGDESRRPRHAVHEAEQTGHQANANQVQEEPMPASRHENPGQRAAEGDDPPADRSR